jgi:threonylcarbamoyladenosine tRNA methylthiotransferase MtaB
MRRRYNREYYRDLIYNLNENIKDVGIGVDVIVGFPGETEEHFNNTFEFLESLKISYLHVFNYSERRSTDAACMPDKVDVRERKRRSEVLRKLSDRKREDFYRRFIGTGQRVLFESTKSHNTIEGYTSNYIRVRTQTAVNLENSVRRVILNSVNSVDPVNCELDDQCQI